MLAPIAGDKDEKDESLKDGQGADACVGNVSDFTVDQGGSSCAGGHLPPIPAGNREAGFADGWGDAARFNSFAGVVLTRTGEYAVSDHRKHVLRLVTDEGEVRTMVGNGEAGFVDGVRAAERFTFPSGLGLLPNGDLVAGGPGQPHDPADDDGGEGEHAV